MSTLEALIQAGQALPFNERQKLIEALHLEAIPNDQAARRAAVLKGRLPSVDEFLTEKHAELEREGK